MMHIVEAQHIRNYLNWKKKKDKETAVTSKSLTTFGCLISFIVEISLFSCQKKHQQQQQNKN